MESRVARLLGTAGLAAVACGGAISVLAFVVARYGPSADGWSFRGNGALAVYPAFGAVMAGGWTALVLHAREARHWLRGGLLAAAVGFALAVAAAAVLPLFGRGADQVLTPVLYIGLLLWMLAAPAWAARRDVRAAPIAGLRGHVLAGAVWLGGAAAGLVAVGIAIPAGS